MIEQTLSQLRHLKLTGMANALQTQQEQVGTYEGLAFAERLQLLVDQNAYNCWWIRKPKSGNTANRNA